MNTHALLAPVAVLVLWSLIVLVWMVDMPSKVNWVSHNYTHLMEQPTIFYATIAVLALAGDASDINVALAWSYVGLRIVHSLWQVLSNVIMVRVALFTLSTFCLLGLAVNAVRVTLF